MTTAMPSHQFPEIQDSFTFMHTKAMYGTRQ